MEPFASNADLLAEVEDRDYDYRVLGFAPGGEPVVALRGGGDRTPGVVLTAGSHAGEHAGVRAAVELVERLDTDRAVHVVPTRDPVGLNGFEAALGLAVGERPTLDSFEALSAFLASNGEVVDRRDGYTLALVGDAGFVSRHPPELPAASHAIGEAYLEDLGEADADALAPLRGRRVYLPPGLPDVEGTGVFDRAHTLVVSPEGAVRHLNRFFDGPWAPPETRAVRSLLAATEPALFVDLHEAAASGDRFWFTIRRKAEAAAERREADIGRRVVRAVDDAGGRLAAWEDVFGDVAPEDYFFTPVEEGLFWLEHDVRDSTRKPGVGGLNATDFAAEEYGLAFTNETGAYGAFEDRVEQAVLAVRTALEEFESEQNQSE